MLFPWCSETSYSDYQSTRTHYTAAATHANVLVRQIGKASVYSGYISCRCGCVFVFSFSTLKSTVRLSFHAAWTLHGVFFVCCKSPRVSCIRSLYTVDARHYAWDLHAFNGPRWKTFTICCSLVCCAYRLPSSCSDDISKRRLRRLHARSKCLHSGVASKWKLLEKLAWSM